MNNLLKGFGNMSAEGVMTVSPLGSFGGGAVWTYRARVISLDPESTWNFFPQRYEHFTWGASLSLRMSDPHFYHDGVAYL